MPAVTPRFFNTLGRRLEAFEPRAPGKASIYTCGPTVYNHAHIGNLRTFVFEDLLCRGLRYLGYEVTQVMNLTDVDDKTIRGAQERGQTLADFTQQYIDSFFADLRLLNVVPAAAYPKATDHIPEMIDLIERLLERGHAYLSDGSVWFRLAADEDYGRLSGFRVDAARQSERVASDEYEKEDVRDFVLWKGAKPGEPSWPSPWGEGRPGWHIECSAMSAKYLGEGFDIHCGGVDNIFPHHENEIAQSESATGRPFARYWLHAEHLIVDGEKMSKSLGNQYTLKDLIERGVSPRAVRYVLASVHYRQKINFTWDSVTAASGALRRVDDLRARLAAHPGSGPGPAGPSRAEVAEWLAKAQGAFTAALADDLNLSAALAALFDLVRAANVALDAGALGEGDAAKVDATIQSFDRVLGVFPVEMGEAPLEAGKRTEIERLVEERNAARKRKDFAASDRLREELTALGVVVEDTAQGTRWKLR